MSTLLHSIPAPENTFALLQGPQNAEGKIVTWWIPVISIRVYSDGDLRHILGCEAQERADGEKFAYVFAEVLPTFAGIVRVPPAERPGATKSYYTPTLFYSEEKPK